MKLLGWMVGSSMVALAGAIALYGAAFAPEIVWGLAGPLAVAAASWIAMVSVQRRNPRALTGLMMAAFAAKVVFFGVYVAIMLKLLLLRPTPFVASFTISFIALYTIEAFGLRKLLAEPPRRAAL